MKKKKAACWFVVGAALMGAFLVLIALLLTVDVASVRPFDEPVGLSSLNRAALELLGQSKTLLIVSEISGALLLLIPIAFALLGALQLVKGRSFAAVDRSIRCLGGLYVLVAGCYLLFEIFVVNYRPIAAEDQIIREASFPSSHTLLAVTVGVSAMLWVQERWKERRTLHLATLAGLTAVTVLTVVCRALSGVHWLTDILGGLLLSGALVCFYMGASRMLCEFPNSNKEETT